MNEQLLSEPLAPELIRKRQGNAYIEGSTAIDQANRIFGFTGWGYDLVDGPDLVVVENIDGKTGEIKRAYAYRATVRVTAGDAPPRTDFGFHPVQPNRSGIYTVEAHDTASKAAVTDGMKRALRSFGDQFGNGLYGGAKPAVKPATAPPVGKPAEAAASAAQMKDIDRLGRSVYNGGWPKKKEIGINARTGGQRPLTPHEAAEIIDGLKLMAEAAVKQAAEAV